MTEKPFIHSKAFANVKNGTIPNQVLLLILNYWIKKTFYLVFEAKYIYDFAKKDNDKIKKIYLEKSEKIKLVHHQK